ncbi:dihydrofolate reductase family protein [Nonomuraea sp. NPDC049725]|uniref:dihydrofolate reductase family protein n=1 Tax=Nonomuraea sp. NPDC049725 TaxID=3154508 RepID=UPI00344522D8
MRKVIASVIMSLDGVIERPEEWSMDYWSDEAESHALATLKAADALLMGRVTYEGFAEAWPAMEDEGGYAARMNSLPKYVVSSTLEKADWNNSTVLGGDAVGEVRKLKEQPGGDILIYGWGRLTATLVEHGLLDEVQIWLHPVLVGSGGVGELLYNDGTTAPLRLAGATPLESGIVILTYRTVEKTSG